MVSLDPSFRLWARASASGDWDSVLERPATLENVLAAKLLELCPTLAASQLHELTQAVQSAQGN